MARVAVWERARAVARAIGWLLLFAAVGLTATVLAGAAARWASGAAAGPWTLARDSAASVGGFVLATWLVGHVLNRRSWTLMGWGAPRRLAQRLGIGVGVGGLMAALAVGAALALSGATLRSDPATGFAAAAAPLGVGLLCAALAEELMFRGYPLRRLADAVGPGVATGLLALGFSAAHLANPSVSVLGAANIAIAAVWLSAAFFSTGAMPLAWGLHFGWNAGLALGFEAPVSGFTFELPLVDYAPGRHGWVDGGAFGPEGGLVGTLALVAGTVWLGRGLRAGARSA